MTYIVALTGGIGSGKSTVANAFANLGVPLVDADIIARQVVEPGMPALMEIASRYGETILHTDGTLNRAALRKKIFSEPQEKAWLNSLLHPLIQQETQSQLANIDEPYVLWVVPLLVENGLHHRANRVLVVDVAPEIQLARTMARDGITRQQAEDILASQVSRQQRLTCADDIIDNSGDPIVIAPQVTLLHQQYLKLAAAAQQDLHR
ncbi:TPA: dephospho-CoA kinase [Yersinia enterocolitica]|uniref:Dephospho-CoA kinase n=1 Tax=Yersinia enterocolitica TaxID=630 RepID=A0A9P1PYU1_YEREN|nr:MULTISPECIES: dephospho-CoA kinase [Yersinia]EKN3400724.1 dephospho-CoA kinase [Yersinia enterocolitica]EKN3458949.1 dephospho-CoA kinase [Yersinia enterocolitica]EKN3467625.1 dephospho-CoA kinase [Yersinia enterocolitica]EKN3633684.1 dephospho-CoA kinase [Yersinia enterocolitica]EKN3685951.1 dephospho-CoA kinase [Yersinia enterocolitica]